MPDVPDCPFCAIARGADEDVEPICEAEAWLAFFPREPATPGHTMVIPRVHVRNIWEADPSLGAELMAGVIRVGRAIQAAEAPQGMNLISSSGDAAEQTVFHAHLHVLPRWDTDAVDPIWPPKKPMDDARKAELAERIRVACERLT